MMFIEAPELSKTLLTSYSVASNFRVFGKTKLVNEADHGRPFPGAKIWA